MVCASAAEKPHPPRAVRPCSGCRNALGVRVGMQHRIHPLDRFAVDPVTSCCLFGAWLRVVHATSRRVPATPVHIHRDLWPCSAIGVKYNEIVVCPTEAHAMYRIFHECAHTTFESIVVRYYFGVFHSASCIYRRLDIYADDKSACERECSRHRSGAAAYVYCTPRPCNEGGAILLELAMAARYKDGGIMRDRCLGNFVGTALFVACFPPPDMTCLRL